MTAPRRIIEGRFYLVTRRTWLRTFFLRPGPDVNRMFEYCLGEAAKKHNIDLIAWCAMSNHYHAVIYDPDGRVPAFIERFHKMLAKVLSVHYRRFESIWSRDQTCLTRLVTMNDVFEKVVYVLSNPAAAHLVEDIVQYPGSSSWNLMGHGAKTVQRPKAYFREDGRMPAQIELRAVAPRGLRGESYGDWITRVRTAVKKRQSGLADERKKKAKKGRGGAVLGPAHILKTDPLSRPTTEAPRWRLRPHLACKDKERMREERRALKEFREAYTKMRIRLRSGGARVVFPEGTYRLRLLGLRCSGCLAAADARPGTATTNVKQSKCSRKAS